MDVTSKELVMQFDEGDEVVGSIMQALQDNHVQWAVFSSVSGRVRDFDVSFLQAGKLQKKHFDDEHKWISISGDVKLREGKGYVPNIIIGLSNLEGSKALGGQLHSGHAGKELVIRATIKAPRE